MPITRLSQLLEALADRPKRCLVAVSAHDRHTLEAIATASERHLVDAILVGDEPRIRQELEALGLDAQAFTLVHEPMDARAAARAVELVRQEPGRFLMKGALTTDLLLHAILARETGLAAPGTVISHVTLVEHPAIPRLLVISDAAVIPQPDIAQKTAITHYVIRTARTLGISRPKVAVLGMTEQVNPKFPSLTDAAILSKMAERGQFGDAAVDGPMALDIALDPESAQAKHVGGEVAGQADGLVFPNIEAGNVFYKACAKLAGCQLAGMLVGPSAPCVVASRSDTAEAKLHSIALAALSLP